MTLRSALVAFAALPFVACGDDKSSPADTSSGLDVSGVLDTTTAQDTTTGTDTTTAQDTTASSDTTLPMGCDRAGWTPAGTEAMQAVEDGGALVFGILESYSNDTDPSYDVLTVEVYYDLGATTDAQTITLGENYIDCSTCVFIYAGCPDDGSECAQTFFAQNGTLEVTGNGGSSGRFTGTLRNVQFAEVTIAEDFTSTVIPNGQVWCLDSYALDVEITLAEGE